MSKLSNEIKKCRDLIATSKLYEAAIICTELMSDISKDKLSLMELSQVQLLNGVIHYKQKKYKEAKTFFSLAIANDPTSIAAVSNLACALEKLNELASAIELLKGAQATGSPNEVLCCNLANILLKAERRLEAQDYYEQALKINPSFLQARINLVYLYLQSDEYNLAIQTSRPAENIQNLTFLGNLYLAHKLSGDRDSAKKILYRINKIPPRNENELKIMGFVKNELGKSDEIPEKIGNLYIPNTKTIVDFSRTTAAKTFLNSVRFPAVLNRSTSTSSLVPIILTAATQDYIDAHFPELYKSWKQTNSDLLFHLHIYKNNDESQVSIIKEYNNNNFSISYEIYKPENKSGYTMRRFLTVAQLINKYKTPVVLIDIDQIFQRPLRSLFFSESVKADIAIQRRKKEIFINQVYNASLSVFYNTSNSHWYLNYLTNYFSYLELSKKSSWFADQIAILQAVNAAKTLKPNLSIFEIPENVTSHSKNDTDNAYLRHFKGQKIYE